jgi:hypothetical protein
VKFDSSPPHAFFTNLDEEELTPTGQSQIEPTNLTDCGRYVFEYGWFVFDQPMSAEIAASLFVGCEKQRDVRAGPLTSSNEPRDRFQDDCVLPLHVDGSATP